MPPDDAVPGLASRLESLADELRQWEVLPGESAAGTRHDIPGRGRPMLLTLIVDEWTDTRVRGSVTFTRAHLGGNGAATEACCR